MLEGGLRNSSSPLGIDAFKVTENQNQSVERIRFILRASGPTADDVSKSRGRASPCPHWHCGSLKVLELHALLEAAQPRQHSALAPDMLCPTVGLISTGREAHQDHYLLLRWSCTCPPSSGTEQAGRYPDHSLPLCTPKCPQITAVCNTVWCVILPDYYT